MALNTDGINAILNDGNEAVVYAAVGDGPTDADETSSARIALTLGAPSGGIISVTNVPLQFTGTPAAGATHVLLFSAAAAGTFYGFETLAGGQAFSAEGDYWITSLTLTGASS